MTNIAQESDIFLSNAQRKEHEKESQILAEYAATVSMGWLVKYGLNQPCAGFSYRERMFEMHSDCILVQ